MAGADDDGVDGAGGSADAPRAGHHADLDRDVGRVRDDVEDGGTALRLRDERRDFLARRVGVDMERHLDAVEAVAHLAVDAEDALHVHAGFDRGLDRAQLDVAVLRHGRRCRP